MRAVRSWMVIQKLGARQHTGFCQLALSHLGIAGIALDGLAEREIRSCL